MRKQNDTSLETELTQLMFQAISQSDALREYIHHAAEEGKITSKSLLTFCLRPLSLLENTVEIKGLAEKETLTEEETEKSRKDDAISAYKKEQEETLRKNAEEPFEEESWLRKLRLISPFS